MKEPITRNSSCLLIGFVAFTIGITGLLKLYTGQLPKGIWLLDNITSCLFLFVGLVLLVRAVLGFFWNELVEQERLLKNSAPTPESK